MPIIIDPETRQRVVTEKHTGDIVYFADTNTTTSAVYNESVPILGAWSDYTGSGDYPTSQQMQFGGFTNTLFGTSAQIESNANVPPLNEVGENDETHRRRIRLIHRDLSADGKL